MINAINFKCSVYAGLNVINDRTTFRNALHLFATAVNDAIENGYTHTIRLYIDGYEQHPLNIFARSTFDDRCAASSMIFNNEDSEL